MPELSWLVCSYPKLLCSSCVGFQEGMTLESSWKYVQLDRKVAEKRLREHMGDPVAAIRSFLDS